MALISFLANFPNCLGEILRLINRQHLAFAGGLVVGLVEATTALILPPSLKSVGIYAVYLLVVFVRPRGLFGSL